MKKQALITSLKALIIAGSMIAIPAFASASTISPVAGIGGVTTVTLSGSSQPNEPSGTDNQASFFLASNGAFIGYTTSSGSYTIPSQTAGTIVDVVFYDNNLTAHSTYCGDSGVTNGSTNLANCLSNGNNNGYGARSVSSGYLFELQDSGIAGIIATSTAIFLESYGFNPTEVVYFMAGWLIQILGAGLGVLVQLLPYIIGLAVIGAIVYFLYRAFRFFRS